MGAYKFVTPEFLRQYLIGLVNQSSPSASQPLLASLETTAVSLRRGNTVSALNQLRAFQNKVRAQVEPADSASAAELARLAQEMVRALDVEKGARKGATK